MLSLLGSLLGFGTSFLPNVLGYFQDKQDKKHELAMIAAQTEAQAKLEGVRLQSMNVEAEIRELEAANKAQNTAIRKGSKWLANLSGSIRPVVTYLFVIEFLLINWSIAYLVLNQEGVTIENLQSLLNDEFMTLLSAMISFWFGNRTFGKRKA